MSEREENSIPRVGVYVCDCGTNIAATVNTKEVAECAAQLPGVVVVFFLFGVLKAVVARFYLQRPALVGVALLYLITTVLLVPTQNGFTNWLVTATSAFFALGLSRLTGPPRGVPK